MMNRGASLITSDQEREQLAELNLVAGKRALGLRALGILDRELSNRAFIAGDAYSIADISLFAYAHLANDAGLSESVFHEIASAQVEHVGASDLVELLF